MVRLNGRNLTSRISIPLMAAFRPSLGAAQDRVNAVQNARREHPADGPEDRTNGAVPVPRHRWHSSPRVVEQQFVRVVQTLDHLALLAELMGSLRIIPSTRGSISPGQFDRPLGIHGLDGKAIRSSSIQPITRQIRFRFLRRSMTIYISGTLLVLDANTLLQEVT